MEKKVKNSSVKFLTNFLLSGQKTFCKQHYEDCENLTDIRQTKSDFEDSERVTVKLIIV